MVTKLYILQQKRLFNMNWVDITFVVANISVLIFLILQFYKRNIETDSKILFGWTLLAKTILTLIFALLFKFYFNYETDVDVYYNYALKVRHALLAKDQGFFEIFINNSITDIYYLNDRSYFFIKLLTLVHFITNNNYWLDCVWFSIFNYYCCWFLILKVKKYYFNSYIPLTFVLFFLPVPNFWSCGPVKDSVAFSMLLLLLGFFFEVIQLKKYFKFFIQSILPCYFIFKLKFYVLGALAIVCIPFLITRFIMEKLGLNKSYEAGLFIICLSIIWMVMEMCCLWVYGTNIIALIFYNYEIFVNYEFSNYQFNRLSVEGLSFIPNIPKAIWNGLLMPLPWNAISLIMKLESVFNLTIILISLLALILGLKQQIKPTTISILIILYILINSAAFGFSSPNWGTLSRYKIYYSPFYYFFICYILYNSKFGYRLRTMCSKLNYFSISTVNQP